MTGAAYTRNLNSATNSFVDEAEQKRAALRKSANSQAHRAKRQTTRDIAGMYFAIAKAMGLESDATRTAFAISSLCYDRQGEDYDTPREISLASIGAALSSRSDDAQAKDGNVKAAWEQRARRHAGGLFNQDLPRAGYQLLARFKSNGEGAHKYADHGMPVAVFFAELFDEERKAILCAKDVKGKAAAISAARDRLAVEALAYFQKLDTAILEPDGKVYAVVSEPTAKAYCLKNPAFKTKAYVYQEPAPPALKPFYREDLERLEERIRNTIDDKLNEVLSRNSFDEARMFAVRLQISLAKALRSWEKTAADMARAGEADKRINHVLENDRGGAVELEPEPGQGEGGPPYKMSGGGAGNSSEQSNIDFSSFETPIAEASAETFLQDGAPVAASLPALEVDADPPGQVNFDSALQAAEFYVRDGWAVVPCCQFDPATDRCTGPSSHQDQDGPCRGKRPVIKGRKPIPGAGYTAASRDAGLVRDWFSRQFPDAGVALRLDGHILIDCDVKDGAGGLESYDCLSNTFDIPATLTATTPSGGRHYIFKLPEDLPPDFLGSWTRVLDAAELRGIDLKVGNRGLVHVEPSRGVAGVYRWLDPAAEIAELPRRCCDYLHKIHMQQQQAKQQNIAAPSLPPGPSIFDPNEDQAKYFKDAGPGERRPRLRSIACRLASAGATEQQIVAVLNYHDARFTQPTNDAKFIANVARGAVSKFAPAVASI